jgi:hypothetical protein
MSISSLTAEATRLIAVFQDKEADIDAALVAAVAAVSSQTKTINVDSIGGLDTNAGTYGAPVKTLDKANTLLQTGGMNFLILAKDGEYDLDTITALNNAVIGIDGSWSPAGRVVGEQSKAIINQGAIWDTESSTDFACGYKGFGIALTMYNVDFHSAEHTDVDRDWGFYNSGIINNTHLPMNLSVVWSDITINDAELAHVIAPAAIALKSCEITIATVGSLLILIEEATCQISTANLIINDALTLPDIVDGVNPTNTIYNADVVGA